ncbi:MAG TPA: hypothetical protein VGV59_09605 [Pyrinomonadaceae bacterium]|nr:hypothetical protein [Pyrinomonadaceae bacterium]
MSKEQSPPVRKIIPYKKGGPRKSPFAEMAFQFSGTALDVAIQQREQGQEEEKTSAKPSAQDPSADAPAFSETADQEIDAPNEVANAPAEPRHQLTKVEEQFPSVSATTIPKPEIRPRKQPARGVRILSDKKSRMASPEVMPPRLEAFMARWRPFLTETQIGICTYIYDNSIAIGEEYCFTSTAKLMSAVSKTERQIKTVLNQLLDWGFLAKGETIVNAPREKRGTYYKLLVDKT